MNSINGKICINIILQILGIFIFLIRREQIPGINHVHIRNQLTDMRFIADLHIHSHFSRATSKMLTPEYLDYYAGLKGIKVAGTGDFTHPGWLSELKEKTEPDGYGFLKLKQEYKSGHALRYSDIRFLLTAEISNIYKRNGKVRKVHSVILSPGFEEVEKINRRLINLGGNLTSDGRPILGLDTRDLLEIVLECSEHNYFIPAHIWTPWFSMLGSNSGFDSPEECFADLTKHIHTIETGLSTDPPMNWLCSFLDNITLASNSDAHSPEKLGRNANIFNTDLSYYSLTEALRSGDPEKFHGTIDMFPEEGKYHYDGHRKCNICWNPAETLRHDYLCPVCNKPVTAGVMNRIIQLSDREDIYERSDRLPFRSIIPLRELLSEIAGTGVNSKKVEDEYFRILKKLGTELEILLEIPEEKIESEVSVILAEAIRRMRNRQVIIQEGYDGEYGKITVFRPGEIKDFEATGLLFQIEKPAPPGRRELISFDLKGIQDLLCHKENIANIVSENKPEYKSQETPFPELNPVQAGAVKNISGPSIIIAGPGTGKTKTLTGKIRWLTENCNVSPENILAITFTNKAAGELKERLKLMPDKKDNQDDILVATFHGFGLSVLKKFHDEFNRTENFIIVDEILKNEIIKSVSGESDTEVKKLSEQISQIKSSKAEEIPLFKKYESQLQKIDAFDLDDLIIKPLTLFKNNDKICRSVRERLRYIFVDEYQDINNDQYRLLRLLAPDDNSNICVVGDANQSIYGFRGAGSDYIDRFTNDYLAAKVFRLVKSYRCSQTILNASSNLLDQPSGMLEGLTAGVKISVSGQPTGAAEAEFIARQIEELMGGVSFFSIDSSVSSGFKKDETFGTLSDIAILCRTRNQFSDIINALKNHNIPWQETGTTAFFRDEPFQSLSILLKAVSTRNFKKAEAIFSLKKIKLTGIQFENLTNEIDKQKLTTFLDLLKHTFFEAGKFKEDQWNRFILIAGEMKNITDLAEFMALGTGADTYNNKLEAVTLMTIHASKGLEFECVFIPGCEKGLIPYEIYKTDVNIEEEKRLLYVGMTRAKRLLYLTHASSRIIRGRKFNLPASPFINKIQSELLNKIKSDFLLKAGDQERQLSLF